MDDQSDTPAYIDLWARPGFLIRRLHQISVSIFLEEMGTLQLTPVQFGALSVVNTKPGLDQTGLGNHLGIDRANSADVVKRLRTAGYVERRASPTDARLQTIFITESGVGVLEQASKRFHNVQKRLLEPLTSEERKAYLDLTKKLVLDGNSLGRTTLNLPA